MEETVAVNVVERRGYLLDYVPDLLVRKRVVIELAHLHHPIQVHIEQLEHHIKRVIMPDDLHACDNVLVL